MSTTHHVKDSLQRPRKTTGLPKTLPSTHTRWRHLYLGCANPLIWRALRVRYRICLLTHLEARGQSDDDRELALVNMDNGSRRRAKRKDAHRKKAMTTSRPSVRMKRLTLDLPEVLHRVIKKNAAEEGVTMAQKLRAILAKHYRVSEESL